jgi:hypothetical protein
MAIPYHGSRDWPKERMVIGDFGTGLAICTREDRALGELVGATNEQWQEP